MCVVRCILSDSLKSFASIFKIVVIIKITVIRMYAEKSWKILCSEHFLLCYKHLIDLFTMACAYNRHADIRLPQLKYSTRKRFNCRGRSFLDKQVTLPDIPKPDKPGATDVPDTGDTTNVFLWAAALVIGGGATIGTVVSKKKKREES